MWLGLGLKLLGIGRWIKEAVKAIFGWALRNPFKAISVAMALILAWLLVFTIPGKNETIDILAAQVVEERNNHRETKRRYREAQEAARIAQEREIERIETKWKDNANDIQTELEGELAAALGQLGRVQQNRRRAAPRSDGSATQAGPAPSGPTDPSGAGAMPELVATRPSDDDMRICTVNTVKANGWQRFYEKQREAAAPVDFEDEAVE